MSHIDLRLEALAVARLAEALMREAEVTEADRHLIAESESSLLDVAAKSVQQLDKLEADIASMKGLAKLYAARAKTLEERKERIREALRNAMKIAGLTTLRLPLATLSTSVGQPSVRITDEAELPPWFFREEMVRTPDKAAIAAALDAGEVVDGATRDNGKPILTVRR